MKNLLVILFLFFCQLSFGQLKVDHAYTAQQLIANKLIGGGIAISNVVFRGDSLQRGFFDGSNSNIGIDSGIILSSGNILESIGPNNQAGAGTGFYSGIKDPDLEAIANVGNIPPIYDSSFDAASLEFDFISQSDSVFFSFVFASEEYLEFVNFGVNDGFGFFLSGPGISGPFTNSAVNLATIPGTTTYISIDNVNNLVNNAYYIDNGTGSTAPQNTDTTVVQFDGFTTKINIKAAIQCNQTYHIKMVVCDIADAVYNSAVFIEGKTFQAFTNPPRLTVLQNKDTICLGDSVVLNLNTQSINVKSITPATLPNASGIYTFSPTVSTTYELIFEDTTKCGVIFQDTNTIDIYVRPSLVVDFIADTVCLGDSNRLINNSTGFYRDAIWQFMDGDSSFSLGSPVTHLYAAAGNYPVKLKLISSNFCEDSTQGNVVVYDRPTLDFINNNGCQFDSITFANTSTIPTGIAVSLQWNWDYGDGNISTNFNGKNSFLLSGLQTILLTSTTINGCIDSVSKTIIVNPKPTADFEADTVCEGHISNFNNLSKGNIVSWQWNPNLGTTQNITHFYDSADNYPVTLVVTTDSGCTDAITKTVIVRPRPIAEFTYAPRQIYIFDTKVCFTNQSIGATNYLWNFGFTGANSTSILSDPCDVLYPNDKAAFYPTKLYAINQFGCIDSVTQSIEIVGSFILYIPSAFTPNGDGINDVLEIAADGLVNFDMKIFNRWGEKLFETNDPTIFWDGKHQGIIVPIGSYPYSVQIKDLTGFVKTFYGTVNVVR